jgi:hypothetical protein
MLRDEGKHPETRRFGHQLQVVDKEHDVRTCGDGVQENWRHRGRRVQSGSGEEPEDAAVDRHDRVEGRGDLENQQGRIVVRRVQRDPGDRAPRGSRVLGEQRRLPVADRRAQGHDRRTPAEQRIHERAPRYQPWSVRRRQQVARGRLLGRRFPRYRCSSRPSLRSRIALTSCRN